MGAKHAEKPPGTAVRFLAGSDRRNCPATSTFHEGEQRRRVLKSDEHNSAVLLEPDQQVINSAESYRSGERPCVVRRDTLAPRDPRLDSSTR